MVDTEDTKEDGMSLHKESDPAEPGAMVFLDPGLIDPALADQDPVPVTVSVKRKGQGDPNAFDNYTYHKQNTPERAENLLDLSPKVVQSGNFQLLLRQVAREEVSVDDIRAIVRILSRKSIGGDLTAIRTLLGYLTGGERSMQEADGGGEIRLIMPTTGEKGVAHRPQ